MVEIYETGMPGKIMVYVTIDEKQLIEKLFRLKQQAATYYDTKQGGKKIAYHWLLNPVTVEKWGFKSKTVKLPPE